MMLLTQIVENKKSCKKSFAVLIDPDQICDLVEVEKLIQLSIENKVDFFFLGGSLVMNYKFEQIIRKIKSECPIPILLFPGNSLHIHPSADGLLLLSLISGRNPDLLIGQHITAAPILKKSKLEISLQ